MGALPWRRHAVVLVACSLLVVVGVWSIRQHRLHEQRIAALEADLASAHATAAEARKAQDELKLGLDEANAKLYRAETNSQWLESETRTLNGRIGDLQQQQRDVSSTRTALGIKIAEAVPRAELLNELMKAAVAAREGRPFLDTPRWVERARVLRDRNLERLLLSLTPSSDNAAASVALLSYLSGSLVETLKDPFALGRPLFADDFDDANAGRLRLDGGDERVQVGYVDKEYVLKKVDLARDGGVAVRVTESFRDASVAVDARLLGGVEQRWFAVMCRDQSLHLERGGYALYVMPASRRVALMRSDSDRLTPLADWQTASIVERGTAWNRVDLTCLGDTITARINGREVIRVRDGTYKEGRVGLAAGGPSGVLFEARFDNLVVREAHVAPVVDELVDDDRANPEPFIS